MRRKLLNTIGLYLLHNSSETNNGQTRNNLGRERNKKRVKTCSKDGAVYEPILAPFDFLSITLLNHIQGERS
jgi:hypothetical protein